jgi:hypothetical protein
LGAESEWRYLDIAEGARRSVFLAIPLRAVGVGPAAAKRVLDGLNVRIRATIGRVDPKSGDLIGYDIEADFRLHIGRVDPKSRNRLLRYDI